MFSGIGDWLRSPVTGIGPGQGGTAGPGGNPTRGAMLGNMLAGAGKSLASGGTVAAGMGQAMGQANQQQAMGQGAEEEKLWAMLQKLVAQRGLPGQQGLGLQPAAPRIAGPPGQAAGGIPPMGGLY
jgi:hypothetical protein